MTVFRRCVAVAGLIGLLLAWSGCNGAQAQGQTPGQNQTLCVHGIDEGSALVARAGPGPGHGQLHKFPAKACGVILAGRCANNGWCEMELDGRVGWVDTRHIGVYELPSVQAGTARVVPGYRPPVAVAPAPAPVPQPPRVVVEQGSRGDGGACVSRVERWDTLRIRTGPGIDHDEIGGIPPRACGVERVGGCRGRWCKVAWQGRVGWVNTFYLD